MLWLGDKLKNYMSVVFFGNANGEDAGKNTALYGFLEDKLLSE